MAESKKLVGFSRLLFANAAPPQHAWNVQASACYAFAVESDHTRADLPTAFHVPRIGKCSDDVSLFRTLPAKLIPLVVPLCSEDLFTV